MAKTLIPPSSKTIDTTIAKYVVIDPSNLDLAFEKAANATGITIEEARYRYYKKGGVRYGQTLFYTASKKIAYPNTKNVWRNKKPPIAPVKGNLITLW